LIISFLVIEFNQFRDNCFLQETFLMRIALNAALLCIALSGFGLVAVDKAQAAEKNAPLAQKKKPRTVPVAQKSKPAVVVKKRAVPHAVAVEHVQVPRTLAVQSGSALVVELSGGDALYQKNASTVVPIASITKLMTAMVVLDSTPNLQTPLSITDEDVDYLRGSHSRLHVGSVLTRETALLLALMSSENRAAHALARHYPGGMPAFLEAMNAKAHSLGMKNTRFEDPTGLTSNNVSTAHDLAKMVAAAFRYPLIRELSTTSEATVGISGREMAYRNTNPLVKNPAWEVGVSKTGYIHEAGKCLVMQARLADKPVVIVLLDSVGKMTRVGDANRIKRWMESLQASHKQPTRAAMLPDSASALPKS
jgi:D-alanyl-D-alanine endopeptidase (penicillin-binding protein 7)